MLHSFLHFVLTIVSCPFEMVKKGFAGSTRDGALKVARVLLQYCTVLVDQVACGSGAK
jgi:hypothetical protein